MAHYCLCLLQWMKTDWFASKTQPRINALMRLRLYQPEYDALYQTAYTLTHAQDRCAIESIRSRSLTRNIHASEQASTIAS